MLVQKLTYRKKSNHLYIACYLVDISRDVKFVRNFNKRIFNVFPLTTSVLSERKPRKHKLYLIEEEKYYYYQKNGKLCIHEYACVWVWTWEWGMGHMPLMWKSVKGDVAGAYLQYLLKFSLNIQPLPSPVKVDVKSCACWEFTAGEKAKIKMLRSMRRLGTQEGGDHHVAWNYALLSSHQIVRGNEVHPMSWTMGQLSKPCSNLLMVMVRKPQE